jgi:hypothetical protein
MKKYKVWIEVEVIDEDNDTYETLEQTSVGGEFDDYEEALGYAGDLERMAP